MSRRELQFKFGGFKLCVTKSRMQIRNEHFKISIANFFG
ncbi:hypothetical protein UCMB321_3441 [Pseudomonas batumici]|uniref:Uncharacterized protein n=1 Tax=Pseudomonas batumici TaxID=226910 RepID=A0A0C2E9Z5_9PSED|nr:hypothetical protein UCMB321_3441 [Pseudomonas batumici]